MQPRRLLALVLLVAGAGAVASASAFAQGRVTRILVAQGLPGVDTNNWYALFASAKTPPAVPQSLNDAVRATLATPAVSEKLLASGAVPHASSPQELGALLKSDTEKWGKLVRAKKTTAQ